MYVVDGDGALAQAAASEARWRDGAPLSALDGVPVTIKDNIAVKGIPTPVGTAAGDMTPSAADAPPTARAREAGCVLLGKTTMPDFGMLVSGLSSLHGITRNPWNLTRNSAGSSSGAGAGIVAGYGPLALGTDIGGSVRLPAAYNGIFALKPSLGRIPIYPPYLGRVTGPMTRTVMDAALAMTALTRPDPRDYMALPYQEVDWPALLDADLKGKKLGLLLDVGVGHRRRSRPCGRPSRRRPRRSSRPVRSSSRCRRFHTGDARRPRSLLPGAPAGRDRAPAAGSARQGAAVHRAWCARAEGLSAVDALRGLGQVMTIREKAVAAIQGYDFLISPTSPITAYAADEATPGNDPQKPFEHIGFTAPFNFSEQPAASHLRRLRRRRACRSACRSSATGSTISACCAWRVPTKPCDRRSSRGRSRRR